jgi:hypothetical protein
VLNTTIIIGGIVDFPWLLINNLSTFSLPEICLLYSIFYSLIGPAASKHLFSNPWVKVSLGDNKEVKLNSISGHLKWQ